MQSNDNGDGSVQSKEKVCSNEPTPSYSAGKHNEEENKSSNSNDDDFDLDALAAALEQAATVASNTKKKYKSKRANNVPRKCAAVKEKVNDLSIPGEGNLCRTHYRKIQVFLSHEIFFLQFFLVSISITIRNNRGEKPV